MTKSFDFLFDIGGPNSYLTHRVLPDFCARTGAVARYANSESPGTRHWFLFGTGITLWSTWQVSTAAGIFLGANVPASWALEFTLALTFIGIVVPSLRNWPAIGAALTAVVIAVATANLPYGTGLVLAHKRLENGKFAWPKVADGTMKLTPAQFSVLLLLDRNPGRNQTEIANTLGILRPNFVAMLDGLESRDLCTRIRSTNDRRSHILMLTDKGRAVLARAKKLVATKHEARLNELLGPANRTALLEMLAAWLEAEEPAVKRFQPLELARQLRKSITREPVSYTHLRAHETVLDLVCRLLLEKKKNTPSNT